MHLRFTVCIIILITAAAVKKSLSISKNSSEMSAEEIASAFVNHFYTLLDSGNYTQLTTLYVIECFYFSFFSYLLICFSSLIYDLYV